jgi:hypothetical protein
LLEFCELVGHVLDGCFEDGDFGPELFGDGVRHNLDGFLEGRDFGAKIFGGAFGHGGVKARVWWWNMVSNAVSGWSICKEVIGVQGCLEDEGEDL